jgi:outer membrane protein assembly factor BamB
MGNPGWSKAIVGEKSSTPVVVDELLFFVTEAGTAFCLDVGTGETLWKKRLGADTSHQ